MNLIGIDCAVDARKCGFAKGKLTNNKIYLESVDTKLQEEDLIDRICHAVQSDTKTLIAIDAPLGWPINLGNSLQGHKAGDVIFTEANILFRRETDRFVKQHINKQPLDVGADRIARTAWAALRLLDKVRKQSELRIPVTWTPGNVEEPSCIEVYPAATLEARKLSSVGYKGKSKNNVENRLQLLESLLDYVQINGDQRNIMKNSDDAFDSLLCLVAAQDFTKCTVFQPPDLSIAKREGWIWVKKPDSD